MTYRLEVLKENYHSLYGAVTESRFVYVTEGFNFWTQKNKDRYNRFIGVCYVEKENLNKWMVRNGYAIAYRRYSKSYISDEEFAKTNNLGLWSGIFIKPEKWRKLK